MIQNISKEYANSEQEVQKANYQEIIARLFSLQNIAVYILTFMISMVSLGNNLDVIAPFGLALMAASVSNGIPIIMVYLSSLIGTAVKFGASITLNYIAISVIMLIVVLIRKPSRNYEKVEQLKLGGYLVFSSLFVYAISIIFNGFYVYDALVAVMQSISIYIFYKIFVNSINVISQYNIKQVFSIEEIIGASLIIAIALTALKDISVFSFSARNILCIFMILMLGWRNGILFGGISGITVGIVLGIIGGGNPILIAAYAISGMIAGLLNRFGKVGVILGFILGNVLVAYSANGGTSNIIMFQEIIIASAGLLVLPKRTKLNIEDVIPNTKLLPETTGRIEESADTILKLSTISDTITKMTSNSSHTSFEENEDIFEAEVLKAIEGMDENILFDDIANNEDDLLKDIFENIVENDILTDNAIISILAAHNVYLMNSDNAEIKEQELTEIRDMTNAINSAFNEVKKNVVWQKKIEEKQKNTNKQLEDVKNAIDKITEIIKTNDNDKDKFSSKISEIKRTLLDEDIEIKDISIKQENSGKYIINVYSNTCEDKNGEHCPIKTIKKVLERALGEKFVITSQDCGVRIKNDTCKYTYISDDKYILQIGIANTKKDGSVDSGDMMSNIRLGDGNYLIAISDGMGTGSEARKNSKVAISMLEKLLSSGFDSDTSINLINTTILNSNNKDMYATLDIGILDLYEGKIEFLKSGAVPTYLKHNKRVSIIKSSSLPAGMVENVQVDTYERTLENGDVLLMCSDGIIESNREFSNVELWPKYLLEEIQTDSVQRIADIVLRESIDNDLGKPKDDMSVIVAKITKK